MEILLNSTSNIEGKFKELKVDDWLKLMNKYLDIGIVITRKVDKVPFPIVLDDIGIIFFDKDNKSPFYEGYDGTEFNLKSLKYYLELLIKQSKVEDLKYIRLLMEKGLKINDIILLKNGKKGKIIPPIENSFVNIQYKLIKKDGSLGAKNLIIYGGTEFEIEK